MYITFGTGAEAPVPRVVDNRMPACRLPTARGGQNLAKPDCSKRKCRLLRGVSSFPKPVQIPKPEGNVANAPQERRAEPGTSEFGNLPGRLIGAKEDEPREI